MRNKPFYQLFKIINLLCFLAFFINPHLFGQSDREQRSIDSLEQLFVSETADTTLFNIAIKLSRKLTTDKIDLAKSYAYQAVALANRTLEKEHLVEAWYVVSSIHVFEGQLDSFSYSRDKVLHFLADCETKPCRKIYFEFETRYAFMFNDQGQPQKGIELLNTLLLEPDINNAQKTHVYCYLGQSYREVGDYDASLAAAEKIFVLNQSLNNDRYEVYRLKIIYDVHSGLMQKKKMKEVAVQTLEHCRKMDQEYYLKFALDMMINTQLTNNKPALAVPYLKELLSISDKKTSPESYVNALLGLLAATPAGDSEGAEYAEEINSLLESDQTFRIIHMRTDMYKALSDYYLQENSQDLALYYAQEHLRFVREHQQDTAELIIYAFEGLTKVYSALGQFEQSSYAYDTLYGMRMALMSRTQEEKLAKTAVEMDLTENELARQKAEQATLLEQQASASRTRFFTFLLIMAGLILAGVGWAYRRAQRDKQLISKKSQQVEESLAEKEVLLREIHHRVKNNLQIISSLLDKQARKSSDAAVRKLVKEGQERIQSMALIHQNLYESEQLSGIDIKSYLVELTENIQRSQAVSNNEIKIELNVEDEKLDIDTAIPVGLILNELLTNSYKYAFVGQAGGKIQVDFKKQEEQYFLQVSDDGVGFTAEQAAAKTKSLGLNLVNGLVRQLEGTLEWLNVPKGAAVAIKF